MSTSFTAISPIDGRYHAAVSQLSEYFSELALMRVRAEVEIAYLIALADQGIIRAVKKNEEEQLRRLAALSEKDVFEIKKHEEKTAHDVKALEYFLAHKLEKAKFKDLVPFLHIGLTSEDVNNLAYALLLQRFIQQHYLPMVRKLQILLKKEALQHAALPLLARTHGQPASPTTVGKEFAVFVSRLHHQFPLPKLYGKLNGATGNFNAHHLAYPTVNWLQFSERFVRGLGLEPMPITTQVLPADNLAALFHAVMRVNTICIDLCRDIWQYCALGLFELPAIGAEIGSSTMPHKINPLMFENAEGNLLLANGIFQTLASNLPLSRLQRDLVGSTLKRNIGVAFAHTTLALQNIMDGLARLKPNQKALAAELDAHPEVLAEAVQVALRVEGTPGAYEQLKQLTRGNPITLDMLRNFVKRLKLSQEVQRRLLTLTPAQYTGLAEQLCRYAAEHAEIR